LWLYIEVVGKQSFIYVFLEALEKGREEEEERRKVEKIGELFSNHALESDDKEESE